MAAKATAGILPCFELVTYRLRCRCGDMRERKDDVELGSTTTGRSGRAITTNQQMNPNRYLLFHRLGLCRPVPGIGLGNWDFDKALFRILF